MTDPIYQMMCTDEDPIQQDFWMDVSKEAYDELIKRGDVRGRVVYPAPVAGDVDVLRAALRDIVEAQMGRGDGAVQDFIDDLRQMAQEALDAPSTEQLAVEPEADRLRAILRNCMKGTSLVDLGDGEVIFLYQSEEMFDRFPIAGVHHAESDIRSDVARIIEEKVSGPYLSGADLMLAHKADLLIAADAILDLVSKQENPSIEMSPISITASRALTESELAELRKGPQGLLIMGGGDQWKTMDTAPKDGTVILAVRAEWWMPANGNHRTVHSRVRETFWDDARQRWDYGTEKQPTHWLPRQALPPIPAAPKEPGQ